MPSLFETVREHIDADTVSKIARQIGSDDDKVRQGLGQALPVLIAGLSKRAEDDPDTVDRQATEQDNRLSQLLGGANSPGQTARPLTSLLPNDGTGLASLASQLLGTNSDQVVEGLSRSTGLKNQQTAQVISALAPMVLSALNRKQQAENLSARDLPEALRREREQVEQEVDTPRAKGLMGMLDSDNDGQIADDLVRTGLQMGVKRLFG